MLTYTYNITCCYRANLMYQAPWLPFVPTTAITINIYLILNLSVLTLVRFTIWMILGMLNFVFIMMTTE